MGGSFGEEPDAAAPAGSGGGGSGGGSGGGGVDALDAGATDAGGPDADALDAGPDAVGAEGDAATVVEQGCVLRSIEELCEDGCPDFDEAASWLFADDAATVVRRRCDGADGTRYSAIGASFGSVSRGYVYTADGHELVSSYRTSDVPEMCSDTTPSELGFYGRVIHDCVAVNPDDITTACDDSSGPGNGEGNAPEECVYFDG
ncbi:MAG TPA: hypothetical protein VMG12_15945 [Polyangiaceae bacterium]|nr:hypothetical protein [Polyangiaceae bacterium]